MTAPGYPAHRASPAVLFVLLGALSAFTPAAMDMYLPALPQIGRDFGAPTGMIQLSLSSFFVGVAGGQFLYGPASDRFGRRPLLLLGTAVFIATSLGCALADSPATLIGLRFAQGIGASCGMVITRAIVFELFGVREGARYMSSLLLIMGIAPIVAPIVGGWVVVNADWRAVFLLVAAFAGIVFLAAFFVLPETRAPDAAQRSKGESLVATTWAVLRNGPLLRMGLIGAMGGASFFTYLANAPSLFIETFGIPTEHFGYYFGANAAAFIGAAQINRALLARLHPRQVLDRSVYATFGMALTLVAAAHMPGLSPWGVLIPLFILIATFPFVNQNAIAVAQGEDLERTGAVSAVLGAMSMLAGAGFSALSGALHDGSARPMALTILLASGGALALRLTAPRAPSRSVQNAA